MQTIQATQDGLCDTFWALNDQRIDLDRRITVLPPYDFSNDILWRELELVLVKLREVVSQLAKTPATHIPELRAKAEVLVTLLRSNDTNGGPVIPKDEIWALALSLATDVAGLSGS
jgi:hypothetical protein